MFTKWHSRNHLAGGHFILVGKSLSILKHLMMLLGTLSRHVMTEVNLGTNHPDYLLSTFQTLMMTPLAILVFAIMTSLPFQLRLRTLFHLSWKTMLCLSSSKKLSTIYLGVFSAKHILCLVTRLQHKEKIVILGICMTDEAELWT